MKTLSVSIALALFTTLGVSVAEASGPSRAPAASMAAIDANKILAEVDRRAAAFEDQRYDASMKVIKGDKVMKTLKFEAVMQGLEKQLISFTAPGDVAGMKVLMQDAETLYIYMPEFKKVRRVAAHVRNQGFLGSDFTMDDMVQVKLTPFFDAALEGKSGSQTTLVLRPKDGIETSYSKLHIVIDASKGGVTNIEYFDASGTKVREQLREDWKKIGGHFMPTRVTMKDLKTGNSSVITMTNIRVDQGVEDDLFSRRTLLRG